MLASNSLQEWSWLTWKEKQRLVVTTTVLLVDGAPRRMLRLARWVLDATVSAVEEDRESYHWFGAWYGMELVGMTTLGVCMLCLGELLIKCRYIYSKRAIQD